jgi:hypothetical protein
LKGRAVVGAELLLDHSDVLLGVVDKPPGGSRKSAQNNPLAKTCFFACIGSGFRGKSVLPQTYEFPRFTPDCTARHWRALLFVGFASPENLQGETRTPRRVTAECEFFFDSCRAEFLNDKLSGAMKSRERSCVRQGRGNSGQRVSF